MLTSQILSEGIKWGTSLGSRIGWLNAIVTFPSEVISVMLRSSPASANLRDLPSSLLSTPLILTYRIMFFKWFFVSLLTWDESLIFSSFVISAIRGNRSISTYAGALTSSFTFFSFSRTGRMTLYSAKPSTELSYPPSNTLTLTTLAPTSKIIECKSRNLVVSIYTVWKSPFASLKLIPLYLWPFSFFNSIASGQASFSLRKRPYLNFCK